MFALLMSFLVKWLNICIAKNKFITHCCITGANWNNGSNAGPFYLNVNNAVSNSNSNISARHQESINILSPLCSLALAKNRSKHAG